MTPKERVDKIFEEINLRDNCAQAIVDAEEVLKSELVETKRQWERLEDTWLELAERHAALKNEQKKAIADAELAVREENATLLETRACVCRRQGNQLLGEVLDSLAGQILNPPSESDGGQSERHECGYCGNNCKCSEPNGQCLGCCQGGEGSCLACDQCKDES